MKNSTDISELKRTDTWNTIYIYNQDCTDVVINRICPNNCIRDILIRYSDYLEHHGYLDDDWRSEMPTAVNKFLGENK